MSERPARLVPVRAFVDESFRRGPTGTYYVTAAAVAVVDEGRAEAGLRELRRPGTRSVHWHDESEKRRLELVVALSGLGLHAFVTHCSPVRSRDQERARRLCLGALADDLVMEGVEHLVIESRQTVLDRKDRSLIVGLQAAGRAEGLTYEHAQKSTQPLLWAADMFAGIASLHLAGVTSEYFNQVAAAVLEIRGLDP